MAFSRHHNTYQRPSHLALTQSLITTFVPATHTSSSSNSNSICSTTAEDGHEVCVEQPLEPVSSAAIDIPTMDRSQYESIMEQLFQQQAMINVLKDRNDKRKTERVSYKYLTPSTKEQLKSAFQRASEDQFHNGKIFALMAADVDAESTDSKDGSSINEESIQKKGDLEVESKTVRLSGCENYPQSGHPQANTQKVSSQSITSITKSIDKDCQTDRIWMPVAIRSLQPLIIDIPNNLETFEWMIITQYLGGVEWSPSFYFSDNRTLASDSPLKGKAYWMIDLPSEPFAPSTPGSHGAKLTAFFPRPSNEKGQPSEEDYNNLPVFASHKGEVEYTYMGHYKQCRFSDKLDHDSMEHIPKAVLQSWAKTLTAPNRPEWLTAQVMEHFWPIPVYTGISGARSTASVSEATSNDVSVRQEVHAYIEELSAWRKEASMKVKKLTPQAILDAFECSDCEDVPGLRLYWEYLQCIHWDAAFYERMVQFKKGINPEGRVRCKPKHR